MDSDEEYESFQISEEDLMSAFYPRRRRKFTKEDAIYGQWAQHDSDEEGRNWGRKDYARPVNFVSGGKKTFGGKDEEEDVDSDPGEEDLDAEAERILGEREQKKMEKGGKKVGVGKFHTAALDVNKKLGAFQPSQSSKPKAKKMKATKNEPARIMDKKFGDWEKHSNAFGSKMLKKMGWTRGQGLGPSGEGIVNPVKAVRYTEFGKGLPQPGSSGGVVTAVDSEDEEEEKEFEEQLQQWRKPEAGGKAKPKYVYKTLEELKHSGKRVSARDQRTRRSVKVIDMTGPERRVLSSYEEIHDRHSRPDDTLPATDSQPVVVPELLHNIQLLVDRTENEILRSDRSLQHNQDLIVNLAHERDTLQHEVDSEETQITKLSEILHTIELCEQRLSSRDTPPLTLRECEELMTSLKEKYPMEYKLYNLSSVAVAVVFPLIKSFLQGWNMLQKPTFPRALFSTWRGLLREGESTHTIPSTDSMDPYDRLVWEIWMPKFRNTLSSWVPRNCDLVIELLETWMPLLPEWVMNNILEQMVLPRLQAEVDTWNPTTDTMPIHAWVHPWLPLMERRLEILYPPIRYKLATALNSWHPSDASAHKILEPWVKVFSEETMEVFVVRTILPKLAFCLQNMPINPHQQDIAPFDWVMAWRDMIPVHHYVSMLNKHFFPKWLQVLSSWLSSSPNYDEVTKWYTGWKGMLDAAILSEPVIKQHFNHALDMMNHAVAGTFQPGIRENMAYFTSTERRRTAAEVTPFGTQRTRGASLQNALSAPASVSFKDVIERMAEDNGILFMPVPGQKRYEGKALYNFGKATIYIDRGVIFAMKGGNWTPLSLDELRRLAD